MSYPHLDITIQAYYTERNYCHSRLQSLAESSINNDETILLRAKISSIDELIHAATEVRGHIHEHLNR